MAHLCIDCKHVTWQNGPRCLDCARELQAHYDEQNREWWS